MAVVIRYFSTTSAGAGDGTSWANRAALFSGGSWSSIITGFNFGGSDSLLCLIGPGAYSISAGLSNASFSVAQPTVSNPIFFHGCDSSGNLLSPPDPTWTSDQPEWDDSGLPSLDTTNTFLFGVTHSYFRLLRCSSSYAGSSGSFVISAAHYIDWVSVDYTGTCTGSSVRPLNLSSTWLANCQVTVNSTDKLDACCTLANNCVAYNVRVRGNPSSGSGSCLGFEMSSTSGYHKLFNCTSISNVGDAFSVTSANAGFSCIVERCLGANCGGNGFTGLSVASPTSVQIVKGCCFTGNSGYGIDCGSSQNAFLSHNRLRDNALGDITNAGNYPTTFDNYTTDSDDASEYVDAATTHDFRIKNTATIWSMGFGVSRQPVSSGSTTIVIEDD